jgi:hypothetical protein
MRTGLFITGLMATALLLAEPILSQQVLVFPGANSRDTYFTIHNIHPAHAITRGAGAKIGILDHSFGMDAHPELYAGGENFQVGEWGESFRSQSHHGYWMALVTKEIAPEAEVYALNTYSSDEGEKVQAMVEAIDWAIDHDLDAITYSARAFSSEARAILDPAVDRAIEAGVVVAFIHYPHEGNIFPSGIGPRAGDDEREPDLNIFQYDYTVVFGDRYTAYLNGDVDGARGYRPFLSISSTAPVTAAFVALLRSLDPDITPAQVKRVLMASSHPVEMEGREGKRVPDITEALDRVQTRMARR